MADAPVPRYNVLGVGISALTLDVATQLLASARHGTPQGYVCVCGVHGVTEAQDDEAFRRILNSAWLVTPDGMPLVWLGPGNVTRVYGPDLMSAVCAAGQAGGLSHYFLGGAPGVAERLRDRLTQQLPRLRVVGTFTPPFRPLEAAETQALLDDIADRRPDLVWVGISTPKQERLMAALAPRSGAGLWVGVGAAFDFHAGLKRQAPRWMQRSGLEWLFRVLAEPRRLGPRYLRNNPRFVGRILLQRLRLRQYPLE
jgi:N-acetylglucosaminyldiphosphoundecaprenol N-acetyl-beta-D-mannosaminyltransferase